jgi:hypothetical protein
LAYAIVQPRKFVLPSNAQTHDWWWNRANMQMLHIVRILIQNNIKIWVIILKINLNWRTEVEEVRNTYGKDQKVVTQGTRQRENARPCNGAVSARLAGCCRIGWMWKRKKFF